MMSAPRTTGKRRRYGTVEAPIMEELETPRRRQRLGHHATHPPVSAWSTDEVVDSLRDHGITDVDVLQSFQG